jgi:hypothetical protein
VQRRARVVRPGDEYPPIFAAQNDFDEPEHDLSTPYRRADNFKKKRVRPYDPKTEAVALRSDISRKVAIVTGHLQHLMQFCHVPSVLILGDGKSGKVHNFPPRPYNEAPGMELLQQVLATRNECRAAVGAPRRELTHAGIAESLLRAHQGMGVSQPFFTLYQSLMTLKGSLMRPLSIRCSNQNGIFLTY